MHPPAHFNSGRGRREKIFPQPRGKKNQWGLRLGEFHPRNETRGQNSSSSRLNGSENKTPKTITPSAGTKTNGGFLLLNQWDKKKTISQKISPRPAPHFFRPRRLSFPPPGPGLRPSACSRAEKMGPPKRGPLLFQKPPGEGVLPGPKLQKKKKTKNPNQIPSTPRNYSPALFSLFFSSLP